MTDTDKTTTLSDFEQHIGYRFQQPEYLCEALRHSSFVNENSDPELRDNERFEFLGDAVLSLVIADLLMKRFPDVPEGDLSRMRAGLVNEMELAEIARSLRIGNHILLGKGEIRTGGNDKSSILADAMEAVIAAVYLDGGFDAAYSFVESHFNERLRMDLSPQHSFDYKSRLQEVIQETNAPMPMYEVIDEIGPDHDKTFTVRIHVLHVSVDGTGKSKKAAEQDAAGKALELLGRTETS